MQAQQKFHSLLGRRGSLLLVCSLSLIPITGFAGNKKAQGPKVGKAAAARYFAERNKENPEPVEKDDSTAQRAPAQSGGPRYLSLHVGTYFDEDIYKWGSKANKEAGKMTAGVTYRVGEWVNSMDLYLRVDFNTYKLIEGKPLKMSLMPIVTFPDASSGFPLYFGAGAGLGIYFKQIDDESALSFDYQLLMGVRVFDLVGSTGLLFEAGLKNHIHLLSDGQYNGVYAALGTVFNF